MNWNRELAKAATRAKYVISHCINYEERSMFLCDKNRINKKKKKSVKISRGILICFDNRGSPLSVLHFIVHLWFAFIRLEWYLENSVTKGVAVQALDSHQSLIVIGHSDEAETFAFVCLEIPNDFYWLDSPERTE